MKRRRQTFRLSRPELLLRRLWFDGYVVLLLAFRFRNIQRLTLNFVSHIWRRRRQIVLVACVLVAVASAVVTLVDRIVADDGRYMSGSLERLTAITPATSHLSSEPDPYGGQPSGWLDLCPAEDGEWVGNLTWIGMSFEKANPAAAIGVSVPRAARGHTGSLRADLTRQEDGLAFPGLVEEIFHPRRKELSLDRSILFDHLHQTSIPVYESYFSEMYVSSYVLKFAMPANITKSNGLGDWDFVLEVALDGPGTDVLPIGLEHGWVDGQALTIRMCRDSDDLTPSELDPVPEVSGEYYVWSLSEAASTLTIRGRASGGLIDDTSKWAPRVLGFLLAVLLGTYLAPAGRRERTKH